uniref:Uncharacterized protein n=1 Tax=Rhizophora mucronata TaxID=61149 RepID=A0A2P2N6F1_RHIMU
MLLGVQSNFITFPFSGADSEDCFVQNELEICF